MKVRIYWAFWKIFRKDWYSGRRESTDQAVRIYDMGPLTIVFAKEASHE